MEMEIDGQLIVLNAQQEAAVTDMLMWYESKTKKPYILQGFAGTGKTTLLKILIHSLPVAIPRIALVAPTNRAAKVLANKTGLVTRTAFSLIYSTSSEEIDWERSRLRQWEESISFTQLGISMVQESTGDVEEIYTEQCLQIGVQPTEEGLAEFIENRFKILLEYEGITLPDGVEDRQQLFEKMQGERIAYHRSNVTKLLREEMKTHKKSKEELVKTTSVILCDEASMINKQMGDDIVSYEIPTIFVGDPFQLPPVKAVAFWDDKRPDAMLTKIERQKGLGAGIPLVGEQIRNSKPIIANESVSIHARNTLSPQDWLSADQIICGTHKTREKLCKFIREQRGFTTNHPVESEKVVAVYNDRVRGIMNGELYTVKNSRLSRGDSVVVMTLIDPYGKEIPDVEAWVRGFGGRGLSDYLDSTYGKFWFGYAITCHQSQGSEWPNIVVCDDWPGSGDRDRWLYTAITRASQHAHLVTGRRV